MYRRSIIGLGLVSLLGCQPEVPRSLGSITSVNYDSPSFRTTDSGEERYLVNTNNNSCPHMDFYKLRTGMTIIIEPSRIDRTNRDPTIHICDFLLPEISSDPNKVHSCSDGKIEIPCKDN